jgi:hypothetical protein
METITVTPADIIYHRRLAVLDHAQRCGNVSEACRAAGVSRTRYYEWKNLADRYGTEALMPKGRLRPQLPHAIPTHVVEQLLTLAVLEPTLGARRLADRLADQGWPIASSTAQKYLNEAGLGSRRARIARAALVAAAAGGIVTEAARQAEPMGFCHASAAPGELVSVDSFYIGNLKGVGRVYQLTAVDVFTRWATVAIIVGTPTGAVTARLWPTWSATGAATATSCGRSSPITGPSTSPPSSARRWRPRTSVTCVSRPAPPTTTRWSSASTEPSSRSAGGPPSTGGASPAAASSKPPQTPG